MKKNILLIILSIFAWINLYASSMSNDSIKLESIQKDMVECISSLNNRTDYNSNSYLRTTIKSKEVFVWPQGHMKTMLYGVRA